jgi:hypothetical protein
MQLNKDADKTSEHMDEARKRRDTFCADMTLEALADARKHFHALSDQAWAAGDIIEHRICCMAANECVGRWQEVRQAYMEHQRKGT